MRKWLFLLIAATIIAFAMSVYATPSQLQVQATIQALNTMPANGSDRSDRNPAQEAADRKEIALAANVTCGEPYRSSTTAPEASGSIKPSSTSQADLRTADGRNLLRYPDGPV